MLISIKLDTFAIYYQTLSNAKGILNLLRTLKVLGAMYVVDFPTQCFLSLLFGFLSNIVGRNNLAVLLCSEERQCHRCWNPAVVKFTRPLTFYTRTPLPTSPTPLYLLKTYFFSPFNLSLASFPRHGSTAMNTTNFCAFSPDQGSFDPALLYLKISSFTFAPSAWYWYCLNSSDCLSCIFNCWSYFLAESNSKHG